VFFAHNELDFEKFMEYLFLKYDKSKKELSWERRYHFKVIRWVYKLTIWEDPEQYRADPNTLIPQP
jgi:hypothetical protein